ncbi:hypothetical protein HNO88_003045 [Novosphingobium chloroacetimidivorans]|uniref:Uncharacterized protein n=1 Tax=Novosphingobium chloroacetimidivorans TaxID=1428314 RepID=A0A7W7NWU7_9SPHN|nr:hypothetical protein [Novosphingobium chloroacetimidivorans]MBB4859716.1 hypothetical protein [Novosphingobium chloroacetimidivorans]
MTIRFAGARSRGNCPSHAWRCRSAPLCAANDNTRTFTDNAALISALRHFAEHGLAAAEQAGTYAAAARTHGDPAASQHWLSVCRQFDRKLADRLAARLRHAGDR